MKLVMRNFWWPKITKKVKKYVEGYNVCQKNKNHIEAPIGKLMPNTVPKKPWTYMTKMVHFVLTIEKTLMEEVARLFRDNI